MSTQTGNPLLLVDSSRLTLERTAATTAVAVKYLASSKAQSLAVIGTGPQALAHIRYVQGLRDWESIRVWSLNSHELSEEKREEFFKVGQGKLQFVSTKAQAIEKADVIMLCTSAAASVLEAKDIDGAPLITSISTNAPGAHEIDPALLPVMDVYCDCTATTATVAGEMKQAIERGLWSADKVKGDLGYLVLAHYIRVHLKWNRKRRCVIGMILLVVGAVWTIYSFYIQAVPGIIHSTPVIELGWSFCTINCVMLTIGTFLLFTCIEQKETPKLIISISKLSYGMYLMHIFWLGLWVYVFKGMLRLPTVAAIPIIAMVTYISSYLLSYVISLLPGSKWIIGYK